MFIPRTAEISTSPLPLRVTSSTMIVTADQIGCTMSRRIPSRTTESCFLLTTAGDVSTHADAARILFEHRERRLVRAGLVDAARVCVDRRAHQDADIVFLFGVPPVHAAVEKTT